MKVFKPNLTLFKLLKLFSITIFAVVIFGASSVVIFQDLLIFPEVINSIRESTVREKSTLPKGVESLRVKTEDNEILEVWRYHSKQNKGIAIFFHGNGTNVDNHFGFQILLHNLGITSYGFDYRGFGKSTGWPSEEGLYKDARALVKFVANKEKVLPEELHIVGLSIGTGPASYISSKINSKSLILFAPYTSIPDVITTRPYYRYLRPFSFYDFPVKKYTSLLTSTCVVVIHGTKDKVIPYEMGETVFKSINPINKKINHTFVSINNGNHFNFLSYKVEETLAGISSCI